MTRGTPESPPDVQKEYPPANVAPDDFPELSPEERMYNSQKRATETRLDRLEYLGKEGFLTKKREGNYERITGQAKDYAIAVNRRWDQQHYTYEYFGHVRHKDDKEDIVLSSAETERLYQKCEPMTDAEMTGQEYRAAGNVAAEATLLEKREARHKAITDLGIGESEEPGHNK